MMNLWQISDEITKAFESAIDIETGEIIYEQAFSKLGELESSRENKIENIAKWIKNLDSDVSALKEQEEVFKARRKSTEKKRDSLKKYLTAFLDGTKWEAADKSVKIGWRKSESVKLISESDLAEEFVNICEVRTVNKSAIKKAIKDGAEVRGAELVVLKNIQIK